MLNEHPHRRWNALTGEWVFVSPHRTQRPWQGRVEPQAQLKAPSYDLHCYLCPGNRRVGGEQNPPYPHTYVFDNDFPAFLNPELRESTWSALAESAGQSAAEPAPESHQQSRASSLLKAESRSGTCRVICYSPRHDLTLASMAVPDIRRVISTWTEQSIDLGERWEWVQIFENKGELMGCSNPHPHGQIWASDFVPTLVSRELAQQLDWFRLHNSSLLLDYARLESEAGERVVVRNQHWLAVVPWWAVWPFEILLIPHHRPVQQLFDLSLDECESLAAILKQVLAAYDRLFACSFPFSFGWHPAPARHGRNSTPEAAYQLHAHFYPPLLRSATVRKFMVGYELLAESQRDITPEQAAARLRESVQGI